MSKTKLNFQYRKKSSSKIKKS